MKNIVVIFFGFGVRVIVTVNWVKQSQYKGPHTPCCFRRFLLPGFAFFLSCISDRSYQILWIGSEMSSKGSCIESLVLNAAMFRGRTSGKWLDPEGSNLINVFTMWWSTEKWCTLRSDAHLVEGNESLGAIVCSQAFLFLLLCVCLSVFLSLSFSLSLLPSHYEVSSFAIPPLLPWYTASSQPSNNGASWAWTETFYL
jgi:hypothetical protein